MRRARNMPRGFRKNRSAFGKFGGIRARMRELRTHVTHWKTQVASREQDVRFRLDRPERGLPETRAEVMALARRELAAAKSNLKKYKHKYVALTLVYDLTIKEHSIGSRQQ